MKYKLCHLEWNREIRPKFETDSSTEFTPDSDPGVGMTPNTAQTGAIHLLVLGLLLIGIAGGTFLVQSGVNFLPKAAGKTVACDGQTLGGQSEQSKADFAAVYGPNAVEEWVAEHEKELVTKGIPCKDPGGYAPGIGTGEKAYKSGSSQSGSSGQSASSATCKETPGDAATVATSYYDAKVANNLARFYAIKEGVAGLCVPADLGVGTQENGEAVGGGSGRLMLCSGSDGTLVWKVVVGNSLKTAADKGAPEISTLEAGFEEKGKLREAREKVGL